MDKRIRLLGMAVALLLSPAAFTPALAQNVGDPCTGTDRQYTVSGPSSSVLICNGSTLELLGKDLSNPVRKGVATAAPAATLDVAGEAKIGNTSLACSGTTEGAMRYNSTSKEMEYCNGTAWTSLSPAAGGSITVQYTTATYSGSLGGFPGANAKCQSEFPGSYFCPHDDFLRSGTTSSTAAWIDSPAGQRASTSTYYGEHSCDAWSSSLTSYWGTVTTGGMGGCGTARRLACCSQ